MDSGIIAIWVAIISALAGLFGKIIELLIKLIEKWKKPETPIIDKEKNKRVITFFNILLIITFIISISSFGLFLYKQFREKSSYESAIHDQLKECKKSSELLNISYQNMIKVKDNYKSLIIILKMKPDGAMVTYEELKNWYNDCLSFANKLGRKDIVPDLPSPAEVHLFDSLINEIIQNFLKLLI